MIKKIEEIKSHHSPTSFLIAKLKKKKYIYYQFYRDPTNYSLGSVETVVILSISLYQLVYCKKKKKKKIKKKKLVTLFKSVLLNIPNKVKQEMSVGLFPWCYTVFLLMSSLQCKLTFFKSESATFLETLRYNVF